MLSVFPLAIILIVSALLYLHAPIIRWDYVRNSFIVSLVPCVAAFISEWIGERRDRAADSVETDF